MPNSESRWRFPFRLLLFVAVIALLVDGYFYDGAHTRSAYRQVKIAAQHFVRFVADAVKVGPERDSATDIRRI